MTYTLTQKLDAETEKIMKKQVKYEKDDVQMRERKHHLENKKEKALASLEHVSHCAFQPNPPPNIAKTIGS